MNNNKHRCLSSLLVATLFAGAAGIAFGQDVRPSIDSRSIPRAPLQATASRSSATASGATLAVPPLPSTPSSISQDMQAPRVLARVRSSEFAAESEASSKSAEEIRQLLELVMEVERGYGPFGHRLIESLLASANALEETGEVARALQLYERALHVTRINNGLYSAEQIGIVEKLIDCNTSLANWSEVDDQFQYLHLLYTRVYREDSPEFERGLAQIADWHAVAINNDLGTDRLNHLREALKLNNKRLALAQGRPDADAAVIAALQHNQKVTQHLLRVATSEGSGTLLKRLDAQYNGQFALAD